MENKRKPILQIVLIVLLAAAVAVCGVIGAFAVSGIRALQADVQELLQLNSGDGAVTQEDDVRVAGEYVIRSTRAISDAYLSGDSSQLTEREQETLDMARAVLDEIITDGMSDYEKEKAVYDWMCASLAEDEGITVAIPTTSADSAAPYGVLKYRKAVCVGYATTFRLFMQMMRIECMVVHNDYHSWNLVQLGGDWYHTDIYSDVGSGDYANFNMTDGICAKGHSWDTGFFPAANGLTYCYAYQNAERVDDIYGIPMKVRELLDNDGGGVFYSFGGQAEQWYDQAEQLLRQVESAVSAVSDSDGRSAWMVWNWSAVGGEYLLFLQVHCDDSGADVTEEEQARIDEAVSAAFGDVLDEWGGYGSFDMEGAVG